MNTPQVAPRRTSRGVLTRSGGPRGPFVTRNPWNARRALLLGGLLLIALVLEACSGSRRATAYQYNWDIFFDSLFGRRTRGSSTALS